MPAYEFRCRQCGYTYVVDRPMEESSAPSAFVGEAVITVTLMALDLVSVGA